MKIRSKGEYISPVFGNVTKGQIIDMPDAVGRQWINHGMGELVVEDGATEAAPVVAEIEAEKKSEPKSLSISASQAAPVSQPQTVSGLSDGATKAKRRGRPKKGGS